jgi:ERCC4-related helicase
MSPQILVDAMSKNLITPDRINVIVFDECHRAVAEHPYRNVMRRVRQVSPFAPDLKQTVLHRLALR